MGLHISHVLSFFLFHVNPSSGLGWARAPILGVDNGMAQALSTHPFQKMKVMKKYRDVNLFVESIITS